MATRFVPVTGKQICVLNEAVVSRRAGIKRKIREPLATRYGFAKHEEKHKVLLNSLGQKNVGFRFPDSTYLLDVEIPTLNFFIGSCL